MVKNVDLLMEAHFFNPKDSISIIGFMATFLLARSTDRMHEKAVIWPLLHYGNDTLAHLFNSRMCPTDKIVSIATLLHNVVNQSHELLRWYSVVKNSLKNKFVTDQAIAECDFPILRYIRRDNVKSQHYGDGLIAKSWKMVNVCDVDTLNNVFIEYVHP